MLSEQMVLSVFIAITILAPSIGTEFRLCDYDENYKTTFEERKFYAMIARKTLTKCCNVLVKQLKDIPSNPRKIIERAAPKTCFMYRVCMTLTAKVNATGRSRYQMSQEDTEKLVDCMVRFSKLIDQSLLAAMFDLTEVEALQFNPADIMIEVMGCYLRHVGPLPNQVDPALKLGFQMYGKIIKLLE